MADADATLDRAPSPKLRVDTAAMGADRSPPASEGSSPAPSAAVDASAASTKPSAATADAGTSRSGSGGARGIRQKVVDEFKGVRRKAERSPAPPTPVQASASAGSGAPAPEGGSPPPLALNEDAPEPGEGVTAAEQDAPAAGSGGKTKGCAICERAFSVFRPKHTCKVCAQKICDDCSRNRMKLHRRLERKKGSRLCDPCARHYLPTPTGTPGLSPAPSPPLSPRQRDLHAAYPLSGGSASAGGFQLPRRHSVPAKTLTEFLHERKFADTSSGALASRKEGGSGGNASTAAAGMDKQRKPSSAPGRKAPRQTSTATRRRPQSHLRLRHWVSLGVLAALLLLRVFLTRSMDGGGAPALRGAPSNSTLGLVLGGVDRVLSLQVLGAYLAGLILFDEVRRRWKRAAAPKPPVRRRIVHRGSSTGSLVPLSRSSSVGSARDRAESAFAPPQRSSSPSPRTSQEEDELLEVDTGDLAEEAMDDGRVLDALVGILDEGVKQRAPDGALQLGRYMRTCEIICTFIQVFGRATSFAGSTVSAYLSSVESNLAAWPSPPPPASTWREMSVQSVIEREVELKVANVGGKKKPSCSRCLLRLLWFLEFVDACIEHGLLASQDENCAPGAGKAYEETIGKRHPWLIRKGVMSALSAIPSRSAILASLHITDGSSDEQLQPLRHAQELLRRVADELNAVFTAHDLMDLK